MSWLIKFIQKGGTVKGAIREFFNMNGRMPRTSEMNKILQTFGDKGNFKGWTPRVVEGGKSSKKWTDKSGQQWIQDSDGKKYMIGEGLGIFDTPHKRMKFDADIKRALEAKQKTGLKEFTKKEDIYERLIEPKIDEAAVDFVRRTEGEEAAKVFRKRLIADNEQQLKLKIEKQNRKSAERIRKKQAEEDKLSIFTDERPPKDPEFASGGRAGFKVGGITALLNLIKSQFGKKSITTADKLTRPEKALTREMFEKFNKRYDKNRLATKDELEDAREIVDPSGEAYMVEEGMTVKELDKMVAEQTAYAEDMHRQYMRGELDKYVKPEVLAKSKSSFQNKINKQLETTYDDISGGSGFTSGDYKYDAQVLADGIAEDLGFAFDDLPINQQTQLYNAALSRMSKNLQMKRALKKASKPTKTLEGIEKTGKIDISNPEVADEFTKFMRETDPKGFKELEQKIQIDTFKPPKGKKGHASGGIAGQLHLNQGGPVTKPKRGLVNEAGSYAGIKNVREGKTYDVISSRLLDPTFDIMDLNELEDILKSLGVNYKTGGRVALGKGGPPNKGRRNFMKLMAGLASLPIFGKFFKFAKPAVKIAKLKNTTTTMPAWFPDLVNKFMNKGVGKKIDADIMEFKNPDLPNVKMTKHDDGRVVVDGNNEYNEGWQIDYTPPGYEVVDVKTKKTVKTLGDFEAVEGRHVTLSPEDFDTDPFWVDDLDELTTIDVAEMEKYSTGKVTKTVKDAFGKDTKLKKGVHDYDMAVGKAENEADILRDRDLLDNDFAKGGRVSLSNGGLAKILGV